MKKEEIIVTVIRMNQEQWGSSQWGYFQVLLPEDTIRITAVEHVFQWAKDVADKPSFYQIAPPFDYAEPFHIRSNKRIGEIFLYAAGKVDIFLELDITDESANHFNGDVPGSMLWQSMPAVLFRKRDLLDIEITEGLRLIEGWYHESIAANAPAFPGYTIKFYLWIETGKPEKSTAHDNCTCTRIHTQKDEGARLLQLPLTVPSPETTAGGNKDPQRSEPPLPAGGTTG